MTTAQVVETSVTVTNSSFQIYTHPDDHTRQTTDTPGFKPFTMLTINSINFEHVNADLTLIRKDWKLTTAINIDFWRRTETTWKVEPKFF